MTDTTKLIAYNVWANRKLGEQIKSLPNELFSRELGGSFPSIQLTLQHLLASDWIWLHRWKGIPIIDIPSDWQTDSAPALVAIWLPIQEQIETIIRDLANNPEKEIQFTTGSGATYSLPFLDTVIHSTNHGTYHRGQIVNMIRMLGEKPVNTDYFIYCTSHR